MDKESSTPENGTHRGKHAKWGAQRVSKTEVKDASWVMPSKGLRYLPTGLESCLSTYDSQLWIPPKVRMPKQGQLLLSKHSWKSLPLSFLPSDEVVGSITGDVGDPASNLSSARTLTSQQYVGGLYISLMKALLPCVYSWNSKWAWEAEWTYRLVNISVFYTLWNSFSGMR